MSGPAPIYSIATDAARPESVEAAAWARFSTASDTAELCVSWLAIVCMQIERVSGGLLLLGPESDGSYTPAAVWPHAAHDVQYLGRAAERALRERRGVVATLDGSGPGQDARAHVGYPIEVSGVLHGAAVLDVAAGSEAALQKALRLLHWASAWLIDQFRRLALAEREARLSRVAIAMDAVATTMQERRFGAAALALANELSTRLLCERVSVGIARRGAIEVRAISHTAHFDKKLDLARLIGSAMDEVLDQESPIVYPADQDDDLAAMAHDDLARQFRDVAVCSVPLVDDGHVMGALTFERSDGDRFDDETVELCRTIGSLVGPVLRLKLDEERGLVARTGLAAHGAMTAVLGPRHPGAKLIALVAVGTLAFAWLATGTYRVSAKTVIEGAVQRAAAAPFEGYIAATAVRAGDTVTQGQLLARLDDREMKLEQARLSAEREQLLRKHRQALAGQDRPTLMLIAAQINQTEAQLAFIAERLARATLVAPFDGVVVSGDLTQLIGSPVEMGKVLFQLAPLNAYRVILEVEEREIGDVAVGQTGELVLSGMPHDRLPFGVQQITPVSTQQEGRNFFRVEAQLKSPPDRLRPGMEGVGKIAIGELRLIWIWTRNLVDWVRLTAWKWLP